MNYDEITEANIKGWNTLANEEDGSYINLSLPDIGYFGENIREVIQFSTFDYCPYVFDYMIALLGGDPIYGDLEDLPKEAFNKKILDFGCGSGKSIQWLVEEIGMNPDNIYGLDASQEQIKKAQQIECLRNAKFFTSPMEHDIGLHDDLDLIMSVFSIGYSADLIQTFKNAYQYLKDGGKFSVIWEHPDFKRIIQYADIEKTKVMKLFPPPRAAHVHEKSKANVEVVTFYPSLEEYNNALQKAGFDLEKTSVIEPYINWNDPSCNYGEKNEWKKEVTSGTIILTATK